MVKRAGLIFGVSLISCMMLAGCQKAADKAIEAKLAKEGVKAKVDSSSEKVTIETKDGKAVYSAGKSATIPENFPKDVYVYEGTKVNVAIATPDGFSVVMESSDAPEKIVAAYKSKMAAAGWKEEMVMNQGAQSMLGYKKEKRVANVIVINEKKPVTAITLTVSGPKQK